MGYSRASVVAHSWVFPILTFPDRLDEHQWNDLILVVLVQNLRRDDPQRLSLVNLLYVTQKPFFVFDHFRGIEGEVPFDPSFGVADRLH